VCGAPIFCTSENSRALSRSCNRAYRKLRLLERQHGSVLYKADMVCTITERIGKRGAVQPDNPSFTQLQDPDTDKRPASTPYKQTHHEGVGAGQKELINKAYVVAACWSGLIVRSCRGAVSLVQAPGNAAGAELSPT
jgi:hypothetical protein